jgi:hypothetical protein
MNHLLQSDITSEKRRNNGQQEHMFLTYSLRHDHTIVANRISLVNRGMDILKQSTGMEGKLQETVKKRARKNKTLEANLA